MSSARSSKFGGDVRERRLELQPLAVIIGPLFLLFAAGCTARRGDDSRLSAAVPREIAVGTDERSAINGLRAQGYACRELPRDEWSDSHPSVTRSVACHRLEPQVGGTKVIYTNLGVSAEGRVLRVHSDSYVSPDP
jgi:hypothetical protein